MHRPASLPMRGQPRRCCEQLARVGMLGGCEEFGARRISTISPRRMTAIRSQTCAATFRSWVMNSMASRSRVLSLQQLEHLRLHRDVERRDRLVGHEHVGSSASARAMPMRWR